MIKIVLIDDDENVRGWTPIILKPSNIEVLALGRDGDEALSLYKEHRSAVVVLDLQMPNKGGLLAAKEILRFDKRAKIVVYSANLHTT